MLRTPKGQFAKGSHWRDKKPWWNREWLVNEYITLHRSASEIARNHKVHENAILYWIAKHQIQTRTVSEVRAIKHWGALGEQNPMYGKRGILNPAWRGGLTPLRQRIYAKSEWKQFMREVWARDRYCRLCGAKHECDIHHIDPFSLAPLLVMDIGNVILLCKPCHRKMKGKEQRWKKRLLSLLQKDSK